MFYLKLIILEIVFLTTMAVSIWRKGF